jgi:hypothetical protein
MRPTDYLFIAAIVIVLSMIFFNGYKQAVTDQTQETADVIRKAGR